MAHRLRILLVAAVTAGCSTATNTSSSQSVSTPTATSTVAQSTTVKVTSSLDGLNVLPTRLPWTVVPQVSGGSGAGSSVSEVDFSIDGQAAWVEHAAPYAYGSEGNVLVTTFLKPGPHTFTAHVVTADGTSADDTVTARVQPSPPVPAALLGVTWARQAGGRWTITAKPFGWFFGDPQGGGANQDVSYPAPGRVIVRAYIEEPPVASYQYGGAFCEAPDPTVPYVYTISPNGKTLKFTAVGKDGCAGRNSLLQGGAWSRVSG